MEARPPGIGDHGRHPSTSCSTTARSALIEIKQESGHGGEGAVRYGPTDYAAIATGQGVEAVTIDSVEGLAEALDDRQRRPSSPFLIDARIDPSHYPHLLAVTRG